MDAHVFRLMQAELLFLLQGARVEKIHGPHQDTTAFTLFAHGKKHRLVLRHARSAPLLFLTGERLENPMRPPAYVMRLRKYCQGRRLGGGTADFCARTLAFSLSGAPDSPGAFLLLDMAQGPLIVPSLPDSFTAEPAWPGPDIVDSLCGILWTKKEKTGPWQQYSLLTPLLRESLAALDPLEGRALMMDLEAGGGELFLYADQSGKAAFYSAWPLPLPVMERRGLSPLPPISSFDSPPPPDSQPLRPSQALRPEQTVNAEQSGQAAPGGLPLPAEERPQNPCPLLEAISRVDAPLFFQHLARQDNKEQLAPVKREVKKLSRLSQKLDKEEERLQAMLAMREDAKCIQEILWQYAPTDKLEEIRLPGAPGQAEKCIRLNSLLSVRDNMLRMFKESARGKRGLAMLAQRRQQLFGDEQHNSQAAAPASRLQEPERENTAANPPCALSSASSASASSASASSSPSGPPLSGLPGQDAPEQGLHPLPDDAAKGYRHVARFRSSDGFLLLRGKNAQGNHNVLKLSKGHDLWLHAQDGPSAHLIIRRAHAAEEVPETTLREAARLVWEKSWQRNDAKGTIMVAFARYVHSIKGASPGTVKVDAIHTTLVVSEETFAKNSPTD